MSLILLRFLSFPWVFCLRYLMPFHLLFIKPFLFTFEIVLGEVATLTHTVRVVNLILVGTCNLSSRFTRPLNTLFLIDRFNLIHFICVTFYVIFELDFHLGRDIILYQRVQIRAVYRELFCGKRLFLLDLFLGGLEKRQDLVLQWQILKSFLPEQIRHHIFLRLPGE